MSRFKITLEYEGTRYIGWQMQKGGKTIQGELLDASKELFEAEEVEIYGAGRTDSGVHAIKQVAHMDAETTLDPLRIKYGLNDRLPPDISVINVEPVSPKFHARYDATARSYIYQISRRRTAFGKKFVWWIKDNLDIKLMNEAAALYPGLKDYKYFSDEDQEQLSTMVEIKHASVNDFGDMIVFHVVGSHFIWKQVRRMTGVLIEAGRGKLSAEEIATFFKHRSDIPSKLTAPPSGLFLERVYYKNEEINLNIKPVINI